jgi:hypothetical protein
MHFESTAAVRATVGRDIGRQQVGREVGWRVWIVVVKRQRIGGRMPDSRAESVNTGELRCYRRSSSELLQNCWTIGNEKASASQCTAEKIPREVGGLVTSGASHVARLSGCHRSEWHWVICRPSRRGLVFSIPIYRDKEVVHVRFNLDCHSASAPDIACADQRRGLRSSWSDSSTGQCPTPIDGNEYR